MRLRHDGGARYAQQSHRNERRSQEPASRRPPGKDEQGHPGADPRSARHCALVRRQDGRHVHVPGSHRRLDEAGTLHRYHRQGEDLHLHRHRRQGVHHDDHRERLGVVHLDRNRDLPDAQGPAHQVPDQQEAAHRSADRGDDVLLADRDHRHGGASHHDLAHPRDQRREPPPHVHVL